MPVSANGTHIVFNDNSTQAFGFTGPVAAANITGQITAPQIAPGVIPSGGFVNMTVFTSTTPGQTFSVPPTTTRLKVTVVGGGGGGQSAGGPLCIGNKGGAGGGAAIRVISGLAGGNTIPVTVGAGGTAGTGLGGAGGAGGTSSFGVFSTATGGAGGSTPVNYILGGIGCAGQLNIQGSSPAILYVGPAGSESIGSTGGSSYLGGGGQGGTPGLIAPPGSTVAAGRAGGNYGGGGGGGTFFTTPSVGPAPAPGGVGAAGVVIVEW